MASSSSQRPVFLRSFTPTVAAGLTVILVAGVPSAAAAQTLAVSPRVAVMDGDEFALSVGVRGELGWSRLALFGHGGLFGVSNRCTTSLPPTCSAPSSGGIELLGGVRLSLPSLGIAHPAVSLGGGAVVWDDFWGYDSKIGALWEAELRVGLGVFSWSDLLLGAAVKSESR